MTRGRAAGLAVLVLGLLAWRLFGAGPGRVAVTRVVPAGSPSRVSTEDTQGPGPAPARPVPGGSSPAKGDEADGSRTGDPDEAREEAITGSCVLEDGTPLAGIAIDEVSGSARDGHSTRSAPSGEFRVLADTALPALAVLGDGVDLIGADGATLLPRSTTKTIPRIQVVAPPLRLVFRDRAGVAHVRLVDADANVPVMVVNGLKVKWHIRGGWMSMGFTEDTAPGGWIPIPEGRLPEGGPGSGDRSDIVVNPDTVEVEFAMPGFEKGRLPLKDIRGRMTLPVRPVPPDATGEVVLPRTISGVEVPESRVTASLRWTGPEPAPRAADVLGLPFASGRFSLYDLPDGPWVIEIASTVNNTVVRGQKAFEKHGGTADLGTIELVPAGKVVIRVVDSAGEPIPQAWAVIVRPEENPDQGRRLDLNQRGEVAVGDLEPGIGHRAVVKGLPRDLEQTVVAAADAKPVEFKWTEKLVPCRITLIVDGKAVANPDGRTTIPAVVQDSPLPRDKGAWKGDGTFEAKLVPGTYRFSALATPKEGGDLALFSGEVTVPSGDAFEVRLELERGGK